MMTRLRHVNLNHLDLNWPLGIKLGAIALLVGAIAACTSPPADVATPDGAEPTAETSEVEAADAQSVEGADRVVALSSLTADIVANLDNEKLVGMPGNPLFSEDPKFEGIEVVSQGRIEPDLEKIVALEPDLVVGALGFHDTTLASLEELGIEVLAVDAANWDSLKAITTDLAERTGTSSDELMARYDACLAQAPETAPSAIVLVSRQPLLSPNKESWAGDFLAQFNIPNLTADLQGDSPFDGYITLPEEKVLTVNPEMLLVIDTGDNLLEQLKGDAFWGELAATQQEQVHSFEYLGLVNPGSIASIEATCEKLAALGSS
ncbi:MAG: ABC transporter substrate-binding protein [Cyanobacteria bacterium P01_D01_bin.128]